MAEDVNVLQLKLLFVLFNSKIKEDDTANAVLFPVSSLTDFFRHEPSCKQTRRRFSY